jgi:hypothetical protein
MTQDNAEGIEHPILSYVLRATFPLPARLIGWVFYHCTKHFLDLRPSPNSSHWMAW